MLIRANGSEMLTQYPCFCYSFASFPIPHKWSSLIWNSLHGTCVACQRSPADNILATARVACAAGSMKQHGVRPSVRLPVCPKFAARWKICRAVHSDNRVGLLLLLRVYRLMQQVGLTELLLYKTIFNIIIFLLQTKLMCRYFCRFGSVFARNNALCEGWQHT